MFSAISRLFPGAAGKKRPGFTLVELIIAIFVFSVMAAVAIPVITAWLPDYKLSSAARQIGSACQITRLKAATTTREYRLCVNQALNPPTMQVEKGNLPRNSTSWDVELDMLKELDPVVIINSLNPSDLEIENATVYNVDGTSEVEDTWGIVFRPNGSTTATSDIQIRITNDEGTQYQVLVANTTGRVKVEKGWTP